MSLSNLTTLLSLVIGAFGLIALIGSVVVFLGSRNKATSEAQSRLIETLQAQISASDRHIKDLEQEVARAKQTNELIIKALDSLGLKITINGEMISVRSSGTGPILFADTHNAPQASVPPAP